MLVQVSGHWSLVTPSDACPALTNPKLHISSENLI